MSDLISRQAAIDGTNKIPDLTGYAFCSFLEMISNLPSAQPVEDIHREKEQAYYCGYEDGAKAARSAQPGAITCDTDTAKIKGELENE